MTVIPGQSAPPEPSRKPSSVVKRVVGGFLLLIVLLFAFAITSSYSTTTLLGLADTQVCAHHPHWLDVSGARHEHAGEAIRGVEVAARGVDFCTLRPTPLQAALTFLTDVPAFALWTVLLLLLWRVRKAARAAGPFSLPTAGRVRVLGWTLVAGGLLAEGVERCADQALLSTMVSASSFYRADRAEYVEAILLGISPALVITGVGVLAAARVLRSGTGMREEMETLV